MTLEGDEARISLPEEERPYGVDPLLLRSWLRDAARTPGSACDAYCCHSGVYVSLPHRDRILRNAAAVRACMDPGQVGDPAGWFEEEVWDDIDFEGGRAVGTQADERACVFLNRAGLCVLQIASDRDPSLPPLRPFYCRLFPLTVVDGKVTLDDHCQGQRPCCSAYRRGEVRVVHACVPELRLAFSEEEIGELQARAAEGDGRRGKRAGSGADRV